MLELIHTSAPRGLFETHSGYTTVACSKGMSNRLVETLENASAVAVDRTPIGGLVADTAIFRIWPVQVGDSAAIVVTRTVPLATDYTGRPARLTHHLVLTNDEATPGRLAALLFEPKVFADTFEGAPRSLAPRSAPSELSGEILTHALNELGRLTTDERNWAVHLARESARLRTAPMRLRLPPGVPLHKLLAAVVAHADRPCELRIATIASRVSPVPSLILVTSETSEGQVGDLDWSRGRNESPCPESQSVGRETRAPRPAATGVRTSTPRIDLSGLPPPVATAAHAPQAQQPPVAKGSVARRVAPLKTIATEIPPTRSHPMRWLLFGTLGVVVAAVVTICFLLLFR